MDKNTVIGLILIAASATGVAGTTAGTVGTTESSREEGSN